MKEVKDMGGVRNGVRVMKNSILYYNGKVSKNTYFVKNVKLKNVVRFTPFLSAEAEENGLIRKTGHAHKIKNGFVKKFFLQKKKVIILYLIVCFKRVVDFVDKNDTKEKNVR